MTAIDCRRALEVEIPAAEVERESTRIAQDLQRKARVPGFRPGKAPLSLVRRRYEANIREQVLETMLPAYLRAAFERERMEPVSHPAIEDLQFRAGEPIRFKASFEVVPEIVLGDYRSIRLGPAPEPPTSVDQDVEANIERLREQAATYETIEEPGAKAADGHVAVVAYDRRAAGEAAAAHVAESLIEIGAQDTLPEFSSALRGAGVGERRELAVEYPQDFPNHAVAGKRVEFQVEVTGLRRKILPPLDDAFAQRHDAANLSELRERMRQGVIQERERRAAAERRRQITEQLLAMHQFPVPQVLVEEQIERRLQRNLRTLVSQGVDIAKLKLDWERYRTEQEPSATEQVRVGLVLERIATQEHIEASDQEVDAEVASVASSWKIPVEAARRRLTEKGVLDTIKSRIRNDKTLDFLLQSARASTGPDGA